MQQYGCDFSLIDLELRRLQESIQSSVQVNEWFYGESVNSNTHDQIGDKYEMDSEKEKDSFYCWNCNVL